MLLHTCPIVAAPCSKATAAPTNGDHLFLLNNMELTEIPVESLSHRIGTLSFRQMVANIFPQSTIQHGSSEQAHWNRNHE